MRSMSYEYDVNKLWLGGNYCNLYVFTRTDARSNLAGLWCADDDQFYIGRFIIQFSVNGQRIPARSTTFAPAYQTTLYSTEDISMHKTFFVPYGDDDPRCAYTIVRLKNFLDAAQTVAIDCSIQYPQFAWAEFVKLPDMTQKNK